MVQTFTTDRARLTAAIERAATTQAALHVRAPGMGSAFGDADGDVSPTASAESPGRPIGDRAVQSGPNSAASIDARFIKIYANMERAYGEMVRDRNGHIESAALTSLSPGSAACPAARPWCCSRKASRYHAAAEAKFRAVVDSANRANVSFYAIQAKGLKVHSDLLATGRGIQQNGEPGEEAGGPEEREDLHGAKTVALERNEFLLRKDPAASLGWLAKQTGGFLVDNTNDLASAFERIDADRRFHYLLTYTSSNTAMDGTFRRIAVKVKRKGAEVRARSGYVAVPALGTVPVLRFESNALAALAKTPRPTQVPLRAASFAVPRGRRHDARRTLRQGSRQRRRLLRRRQPDRLADLLHDPGARRRRQGRDDSQRQPAISDDRPGQGRPRRAARRHPVLSPADARSRSLHDRLRALR